VGVEINCAGSNDVAGGIEYLFGVATFETTDLGNLAVLDAEVGLIAGHARPIDNRAAFNNGIKLWHNSSFEVGLSVDWIVY
jgi:hypothetical protein